MPPTKHSNRSRRAAAGRSAEFLDGDVKPPKPPASIDILSYPHLLAHILDLSPPSTLSALLKCSKSMFQLVCPRLYRTLRLEQAELKAVIDAGWARSKSGFSPTLRQCLSHTRTLHITDFLPTFHYPKIPRGCFASITIVVLYEHPGWLARNITLPTLFQSLGSHLYIRLSKDSIKRPDLPRCIVTLDYIPKSFQAITFLIPVACYLGAPPSCGFLPVYGRARVADPRPVTVALLPWEYDGLEMELQKTMARSWEHAELEDYAPPGNIIHFAGSEFSGKFPLQPHFSGARGPDTRLTFVYLNQWLVDLEADTVFDDAERMELAVWGSRLVFERMRDRLDSAERELQATYGDNLPEDRRTDIRQLRNDMEVFKVQLKAVYNAAGYTSLVDSWP